MSTLRTPLVNANWKMAMTVQESLSFLHNFLPLVEGCLDRVEVTLCPPATALHPLHQALQALSQPTWLLSLGAQDVSASPEIARTGQLSARLLTEAGCRWIMLGHWEVRRYQGDDDAIVNQKVHRALEAGLHPLVLVGPASGERLPLEASLASQLSRVLEGCNSRQIETTAFVFEPEASIGQDAPSDPDYAAEGCRLIRSWLGKSYGDRIGESIRIIYGGSVTPEHAAALLASPHIDGLGASRRGRDPVSFAEIVRLVYQTKLPRE